MCSRFIHVVTHRNQYFIPVCCQATPHCVYIDHDSLIHSPAQDTWGYYDVATNICVKVLCGWMFPLLRPFETLNSPPCSLQRPSGRYVPGADRQGRQRTKPERASRLPGVGEEKRQTVEGLVGLLSEQAGGASDDSEDRSASCEGRFQVGGSLHPWR